MNIFNKLLICMASCVQILGNDAYIKLLAPKNTVKEKIVRDRSSSKSILLNKMIKSNMEIKRLLSQRSSGPVIWDGNKKILTGKTYRGVLLNSILSTNLKSPVLVKSYSNQGLPDDVMFSCSALTKHSRVHIFCNKMILKDREVVVNTQVLNLDGSSGVMGEFNDGKDDLMAGAVISSIAEGVFSSAQSRVSGGLGSVTDNNLKNQMLGGLIGGSKETSDILLDEMKTKEPTIAINAGTEVLIYFMEALNDY
jgi:hypothetical protein